MPKRRKGEEAKEQGSFAWADRDRILAGAPAGAVLFEAPELRARPKPPKEPPKGSLGLPFGVHHVDGQPVCWSCGRAIDDAEVVRAGPGDSRCPGCGAKLPFI
jgi:hypothetical protein